ncbi:trypsin-3-like [Zeugodacus cucurbitae]|uniref:trypsin-3-like n=1 Tax=Zeugodacus cucurbitae TaxID=28588 RepID=UPI0010A74AE8|nr:trypsin-3-like [Zeugodacus cucurbitae]
MSIFLRFTSILYCIASFLLFVQYVYSLTSVNSHHDHNDHHHHKQSKKLKLPINHSNLSRERGDYRMLIAGGVQNHRSEFYRHVVSVRTARATAYFGDNHFCAGSIISDNLVLTAAHCVVDRRKIVTRDHRLMVVAGAPHRLLKYITTVEMKILDVIPHHEFVREGAHDIALLRLDGSFPDDNDYIKVIPLADRIIPNGTQCTILGWGQVFYRGPYSAYSIHANVTVFSYEYCQKFYPDVFDETMICAGRPNTWDVNTCRGDSGGPLICRGQVAGVVSWSSYCGTVKKPTVFTSVFHHRNWIKVASGAEVVKILKSLQFFWYILCSYIFN